MFNKKRPVRVFLYGKDVVNIYDINDIIESFDFITVSGIYIDSDETFENRTDFDKMLKEYPHSNVDAVLVFDETELLGKPDLLWGTLSRLADSGIRAYDISRDKNIDYIDVWNELKKTANEILACEIK